MIIDVASYSLFKIANGFLDATCTIIGNLIGENNVKLAKTNFKIILAFNFVFNILIALLLFFKREAIANGFAPTQPGVSEIVYEAFPMLIIASIT